MRAKHETLGMCANNSPETNVDGQVISAVSYNFQLATKGVDQVRYSATEAGVPSVRGVVFRSANGRNQKKHTSRMVRNEEGTGVLLNEVASEVRGTVPCGHSRMKRRVQR